MCIKFLSKLSNLAIVKCLGVFYELFRVMALLSILFLAACSTENEELVEAIEAKQKQK